MLSITAVTSTDCFVGPAGDPRQVVAVELDRRSAEPVPVRIEGREVSGAAVGPPGDGPVRVEVPVRTGGEPGTRSPVRVEAGAGPGTAARDAVVETAEPGWTVHMVSHFHYDPVWWNTQGGFTQAWELQGDDGTTRPVWEHNGLDLVRAHLRLARDDPDYKFVLAEVDYLKPFWDVHPDHRAELRALVAAGRVEIVGGTYNEPNTNLTGLETTIRNLVYGVGYQRDILGADPRTAWQLDVFGHDPQFPGLVAQAGLDSSSWARGPFHQWGPALTSFDRAGGDIRNMQFPAEFEWLSPSGRGVLTHYMPNHYSAGWWMDAAPTLAEAEQAVVDLFRTLRQAALTRNVLLPVGTDYTPPNKWVTEIHRDWNARYLWPRFVCALPREFFAAVRAEMGPRGIVPSPQTRDMNPIYTGKDVSYIDTKQAQRAAEVAAGDAEKLATFAARLGLGRYPERALDKVWRLLAYGAHHDAITGSESDQVYIDLLAGWREAHDLAAAVRDRSLDALTGQIDTTGARMVVAVNTLGFARSDLVVAPVPPGRRVAGPDGRPVPQVAGPDGTVVFRGDDVPGIGWRSWPLVAAPPPVGWSDGSGTTIAGERYRITVDPDRGGAVARIEDLRSGRDLLRPGRYGNELRLYDEYAKHPEFGEGPWHLLPSGPVTSSTERPAERVVVQRSELGERILVRAHVGDLDVDQSITLWSGLDRIDFRTRIRRVAGTDRLLRVKFPVHIPGARAVSEVAGAVVGRGFALPDVDTAVAPWTLDNPANTFFALSSTATLTLAAPDRTPLGALAVAVAEVVVPDPGRPGPVRDLVVALGRAGVTATTSAADGPRYGWLQVDSNLPDLRIAVGGPEENSFTAQVLDTAELRAEFTRQLAGSEAVRLLVPPAAPLEQVWVPNADLRDRRALPVLVVAGADQASLDRELAAVTAELASAATVRVTAPSADTVGLLDPHTAALLTRGLPGFAVDPEGALHLSLLRACTGWPSGIWIDPPVRRAPDGSAFQLQHWTHDFEYALVSGPGDWRDNDLVARGQEFNAPLLTRSVTGRGPLPPTHRLLTVAPERSVQVSAVKPAGNPVAGGRAAVADPERLTVRLVETTGRPARVALALAGGWTSAEPADLLEAAPSATGASPLTVVDGTVHVDLAGTDVVTLVGRPRTASPAEGTLGPEREPAEPVYSRYWLHNRGPAPMGFLPVSVAVTPTVAAVPTPGVALTVAVAVASHRQDAATRGELRVLGPAGWSCDPAERPVELPPDGHTRIDLEVSVPTGARPGLHLVRVQFHGEDEVVEDVLSVVVGTAAVAELPATGVGTVPAEVQTKGTSAATGRALGLEVTAVTDRLRLRPGDRGRLTVQLRNHAHQAIDGEAMVASPWGTWDLVGPYAQGFRVEAGATATADFEVTVPASAEAGQWWALVKVMWFGRVQYAPTVAIEVVAG